MAQIKFEIREDPSSIAGTDWLNYICKVKKIGIIGLKEAELWEEEFVNATADAEETYINNYPFYESSCIHCYFCSLQISTPKKVQRNTNYSNTVETNNYTQYDILFQTVDRQQDPITNDIEILMEEPESNIVTGDA